MKAILLTIALVFSFSPMAQAGLVDRIASIDLDDFDIGFVGGVGQGMVDNSTSIESTNLLFQTTVENELGFSAAGRLRYNYSDAIKIGFDLGYARYKMTLKENNVSNGSSFERNYNFDFVTLKPHLTYVTNFGFSLTGGMSFGFAGNHEEEKIETILGVQQTSERSLTDAQARTAVFVNIGYEWEIMGHTLIPEIGFEFALTEAMSSSDAALATSNISAFNALDDTRINSAYFQLAFLF